jgi:hypothetical protein
MEYKEVAGWLHWLNSSDKEQCEWAAQYMLKHGKPLTERGGAYNQVMAIVGHWSTDGAAASELKEFERKMKAAWYRKLGRTEDKDRKSRSYVLSKEAIKDLQAIAGKDTLASTLEGLIVNAKNVRKQFEEEKKGVADKEKQKYLKMSKELEHTRAAIANCQAQLHRYALVCSRYLVALKDKGMLDSKGALTLEPKQELKAVAFCRRWEKAVDRYLAEQNLITISTKPVRPPKDIQDHVRDVRERKPS